MAGRVSAHLMRGGDEDSYWIEPTACPVMDDHRKEAAANDSELTPRCVSYHPLVGRRTCIYWYGVSSHDNSAARTEPSVLYERADGLGRRQMQCGVLCLGARRNRPPGV